MTTSAEIINSRRLAFGPKDNLMNMAQTKYKWADEIYDQMIANNWSHKTVPLGDDRQCYRTKLTPAMRRSFDCALAFASNLDGIQFNNLSTNILRCISAPEVALVIIRQATEEGVHVKQYQTIVEATSLNPDEIYMMFERDGMLAAKNRYIVDCAEILAKDRTHANFARSSVQNLVMEGVFFYSAFFTFFALGRNGDMTGTSDAAKYICRDEGDTHVRLFTHILHTHKLENPEVYDAQFYADAEALIRNGVALESEWGQYIIGDGWLGQTPQLMDAFAKHRGNVIAGLIGLPVLYPEHVKNPVPWFDSFSQPNGASVNNLERRDIAYKADSFDW